MLSKMQPALDAYRHAMVMECIARGAERLAARTGTDDDRAFARIVRSRADKAHCEAENEAERFYASHALYPAQTL